MAQLNASTWIDAYKLVIRQNTADNVVVYNSGIVQLETPFYPTNSMGKYVPLEITVPASSVPLSLVGTTVSPDFKTVWVEFNVAIKTAANLPASIALSVDDGSTWNASTANPIVSAVIKNTSVKVEFTNPLVGRQNKLKIAAGSVLPVDDYFQTSDADIITDSFTAFLEASVVSLNVTSATVCAGGSLSATVSGNKDDYTLSRNAIISVKRVVEVAEGEENTEPTAPVELASRTQAENRVSYSIMGDHIYFHVGASISPGNYTFSYTDNSLSGTSKTVVATVKIIAVEALTYTALELDETKSVVALTMNNTVANAKESLDALADAILLSVDGGTTWTGTETNPIVAVGFTNTEKTYSQAAVNNMRIAFTSPLTGDKNMLKIPAGCITTGSLQNVEIVTHYIKITNSEATEDTPGNTNSDTASPNHMVNGYTYGYKWTLTIWNGYDASDPTLNMIESFEACFDAKDTPVVTVNYAQHITARTGTWTGVYTQGQNVPLMWHRWQLVSGGTVVYDTGSIYSNNALSFQYDGLITGKSYTIRLTCMTQDGVEVIASGEFDVQYATMDSDGIVRVQQRKDGSIEFQCMQPDYITGIVSGIDVTFTADTPIDGHTSISTGSNTTISFSSTQDFDMDFSDGDTFVARIHSYYDGELLRFDSNDGSFHFSLIHRGLIGGLAPNYDLYPAHDLYPDGTEWGEFVYIVNGTVIATVPTPDYADTWYTLCITTRSFTMHGTKLY